jgi:DNA excision repair protein ERCC-2
MARWSDVVVGDYNYWFDGSAMLHALTQERGWRVSVLVDEAHNLVERGARCTRRLAQASLRAAARPRRRRAEAAGQARPRLDRTQDAAPDALRRCWKSSRKSAEAGRLQKATSAINDTWRRPRRSSTRPLQEFYFDALAFQRLAESFGDHSVFDVTRAAAARDTDLCASAT